MGKNLMPHKHKESVWLWRSLFYGIWMQFSLKWHMIHHICMYVASVNYLRASEICGACEEVDLTSALETLWNVGILKMFSPLIKMTFNCTHIFYVEIRMDHVPSGLPAIYPTNNRLQAINYHGTFSCIYVWCLTSSPHAFHAKPFGSFFTKQAADSEHAISNIRANVNLRRQTWKKHRQKSTSYTIDHIRRQYTTSKNFGFSCSFVCYCEYTYTNGEDCIRKCRSICVCACGVVLQTK